MDIKNIYHIAQRAMGAQLVRLNATASNLANADNIASNPNDAYKPVKPVFETKYFDLIRKRGISTVDAVSVEKMDIEPIKEFKPGHPMADENGYVHNSNVDVMQEMVDITAASRSFESAVEASNTAKRLMTRTIEMLSK